MFLLHAKESSVIFELEYNMYKLQNITRAVRGVFILPKYINKLNKVIERVII